MFNENRYFSRIQKILSILIFISFILLVGSYILKKRLPDSDNTAAELRNSPLQTETKREDFSFTYRNERYKVKPLADYELWGLIVTHNNINAWYNYYHDKNSVNLKDICVIWGQNISHEVYRAVKFKSGEWTCYTKPKYPLNREILSKYKNNQLSNNHLLSDDPKIQDKIRKLNIGDQVYLKGMLVSYGKSNLAERYYRGSSLSREDSGNRACETFFVEEIKILKKHNFDLYFLYSLSKIVLILLILGKLVLLIIESFAVTGNRKLND